MGELEDELRYSFRFALSDVETGRRHLESGELPQTEDEAEEVMWPTVAWLTDTIFRLAREIDEMRGT